MSKQHSVLFVSSEVYPFAKASGIADVSYSLPLALRETGHDVRVMMPKYGIISERKNRIHEINRLRNLDIPVGYIFESATIKSSSISNPRSKVQAYVTTNERFFNSKKGVYHDPETWKEYPDNPERFIFFSRSVIETCLTLNWFPDIIHCNDWQTAVLPALAKELFPEQFKNTRFVFTIHNFSVQGIYELAKFGETGLPKEALPNFRFKNKFNFLKGGIKYADYITTVSPSYSKEILADRKLGDGLGNILKERENSFVGILNGIDAWTWNPIKDDKVKQKLGKNFLEFKAANKAETAKVFGFEYNPDIPLIGVVSRLDAQKGMDILADAAPELLKNDVQVVLLGEGDAKIKTRFKRIAEKYPDKFKLKFAFEDALAHQIEAGSDMFIIPSRSEPCGLNLQYSLTYGAVPIVSSAGGLKDVAIDYDEKTKEGNAFVFNRYDAYNLMKAVARALQAFKDKAEWQKIIDNGLAHDYTWKSNVQKYIDVYNACFDE